MPCFGSAAHLVLQQDEQLASWIRLVLTGTKHNNIRQSEVLAGFRNRIIIKSEFFHQTFTEPKAQEQKV